MSTRTTPVLLVTQPARAVSSTRRASGTILEYDMVIGLKVGDGPLVKFTPPDYDKWAIKGAALKEQTQQLPLRMATRLAAFVDYAFVSRVGDFGGFQFVDYLMGYTKSPGESSRKSYEAQRLGSAGLAPLRPAVLVSRLTPITARIGWKRGFTLGINGKNSALSIAPTDQLMKAYGATEMQAIIRLR